MRMLISFSIEGNKEFIKVYRRIFISLFKKVFEKQKIYPDIYGSKKIKPFTFSVWLGKDLDVYDLKPEQKEPLNFIFSTGDYNLFANFYNGVLSLKDNELTFGTSRIKIQDIKLIPIKKINSSKALFKTIGISVLTNPREPARDFKKWYIIPTDGIEKFNIAMNNRINSKYEYITRKKEIFKVSFQIPTPEEFKLIQKANIIPRTFEEPIKETLVRHYNGYVRGFRGIFWLQGKPEILQFIYDYGLGIRTGQGFGMLDVISEV